LKPLSGNDICMPTPEAKRSCSLREKIASDLEGRDPLYGSRSRFDSCH